MPRFNEAAVRRRRREYIIDHEAERERLASTKPPSEDDGEPRQGGSPMTDDAELQRSRRPKTTERGVYPHALAEIQQLQRLQVALDGASTKPPSEDDGESRADVTAASAMAWLQRSRRPKTTESASEVLRRRASRSLQRSRRPKTTESRVRRRNPRAPASRFNEAAVRRRRRGLTIVARRPASAASFNEAAVRRRRRARIRVRVCRSNRSASTKPPSEDDGETVDSRPFGASMHAPPDRERRFRGIVNGRFAPS